MENSNLYKSRIDTSLSKEERALKREQHIRKQQERRAERIKRAELSLKEDTRADLIRRAEHILIEEELAERIDQARVSIDEMTKDLRNLRQEHRNEIKELRKDLKVDRPIGRKVRIERIKKSDARKEHIKQTLMMIRDVEKHLATDKDSEIFEILPHKEALQLCQISYTDLANLLNKNGHQTFYGKKWTRLSVQKIIEDSGRNFENIGYVKNTLKQANKKRSLAVDNFTIKMRDEVLPSINTDQPYLTIAKELNSRGIETRSKKGEWGNVSVKRMLERIDDLNLAKKIRDEVLPSINTDQPYLKIAKELNSRGIKTRSGQDWDKSSITILLERIENLKDL